MNQNYLPEGRAQCKCFLFILNYIFKKDDKSIFIAYLPTEHSLYGQHQLKESKKLFKFLTVNGLVKNVTDHQRDVHIGPAIFAIFRSPFFPIALVFCLALRYVAYII